VLERYERHVAAGLRDEVIADLAPGRPRAEEVRAVDGDAVRPHRTRARRIGPFDPPPAEHIPLRQAQPAERPAVIDQGRPADEGAVAALRQSFEALTPAARAWVGSVTAQAKEAGTPIGVSASPTRRNFELGRALVALAGDRHDDGHSDDALRALAALVAGDDAHKPSVALGTILGSLSADEAATFAAHVDTYLAGGLVATVDDDGTLRLAAAVAA